MHVNKKYNALEKIVRILDQYLEKHSGQLPLSLMNGIAGISVFYFNYSLSTGKKEYQILGQQLLNSIIDQLNSNTFRPLQTFHSYSTGLAGVAFTFHHLKECGYIDDKMDTDFDEIDELLVENAIKDFNHGISDFLHGPMGVLYYLIKKSTSDNIHIQTNILFNEFLRCSVRDQKGLRISNMILEDVHVQDFDIGLAHGLTGILLVFLKYYNKSNDLRLKELIESGLVYILSLERPLVVTGQNSLYPISVDESVGFVEKNIKNYKGRLAWCYGDLNIAWLLINAGKVFNNEYYYSKGVEIGLHTLSRSLNYSDHQVGDVFFCHGTSGVAYFYKRLFVKTGNLEFQKGYSFWMDQTLNKLDGLTENLANTNRVFSMLDGLLGVAFTLLPSHSDQDDKWSEILLMY